MRDKIKYICDVGKNYIDNYINWIIWYNETEEKKARGDDTHNNYLGHSFIVVDFAPSKHNYAKVEWSIPNWPNVVEASPFTSDKHKCRFIRVEFDQNINFVNEYSVFAQDPNDRNLHTVSWQMFTPLAIWLWGLSKISGNFMARGRNFTRIVHFDNNFTINGHVLPMGFYIIPIDWCMTDLTILGHKYQIFSQYLVYFMRVWMLPDFKAPNCICGFHLYLSIKTRTIEDIVSKLLANTDFRKHAFGELREMQLLQ